MLPQLKAIVATAAIVIGLPQSATSEVCYESSSYALYHRLNFTQGDADKIIVEGSIIHQSWSGAQWFAAVIYSQEVYWCAVSNVEKICVIDLPQGDSPECPS